MASIFTKIVKGEIPSYKIAENEEYYAFLDIYPVSKGHTLVIPKQEIDYFFDLDESTLKGLMGFSREIAIAIKQVIPCERISVVVAGFEVPHAHLHLIPSNSMADISFENKLKLSPEEFEEIKEKITTQLDH